MRFHETCLKNIFYIKSNAVYNSYSNNAVYNSYSNNIIYETNLVQNIITGIINRSQLQCTRLQSSVRQVINSHVTQALLGKLKKNKLYITMD